MFPPSYRALSQRKPPRTHLQKITTRFPSSRMNLVLPNTAFVGQKDTKAAGEYHSKDFEWSDVVEDGIQALRRQEEERRAAVISPSVSPEAEVALQTEKWEKFHSVQNRSAKFFKERRYLMLEFPILQQQTDSLRIIEIGCGCGSNVVPILRDNPTAAVTAFDISPAAVDHLKWALGELGVDPSRCTAFPFNPLDPTASPAPPLPSALANHDVAMLIFTLSALPPDKMPELLGAAFSYLKPGGRLLFRDYGLYDISMLRFPGTQRVAENLYRRQDGTLSFFFSTESLGALARAAGFEVEELEYATVSNRNRKTGKELRRVFVHGVFRKPL